MGKQFADDSMTPSPITVNRDQFMNELPSDKPMHTDNTAGEGAFNWGGNQYDDGPSKGGSKSYGRSMSGYSGTAEKMSVDVSRADRGREA